MKDDIVIR